ncbi:MAG: chemotaxis response regulator protein-glutamate methylesterase [Calditerrivibrio sp.]|nr:chemotaxis response regulator protein-glutamate methylesterase [Calditerrivibrio sp.]MCA1932503.1 chemotaxis response regulator protein-glutamate methylesterase [Calditerrivibrio sp.]MCA1980428.1 chemotaxis response regulator protein-glutamate methylesterase [Calditerrivibrio sp.]
MIKVLVVDDSAFMRKAIENMLKKERDIEVVGFARNGIEAIDMVQKLKPDIVTLDIEMPQMDGLTALKKILEISNLPVIMISSLTTEGAEATLKALEIGAVDFISKDKSFASLGIMKIEDQLIEKVKAFAGRKAIFSRPQVSRPLTTAQPSSPTVPIVKSGAFNGNKKIVAIGTSTGGPQSLQRVIPKLTKDLNRPVLVVQHMPPNFTKSLATRLNSMSQLEVIEVEGKEKVEPNIVYIAKGGFHLKIKKVASNYYIETSTEPSNVLHIPSVDVMTSSVAESYGRDTLGVIMTGMGSDGLIGLKKVKEKGGAIIAQEKDSCVVYGMPRAVVDAGIADEIVDLDSIASSIMKYCK